METDQLLDLFNISSEAGEQAPALPDANASMQITDDDAVDVLGQTREKGKKDVLDGVQALWDEKQYEEEYNLDSFLATMKA